MAVLTQAPYVLCPRCFLRIAPRGGIRGHNCFLNNRPMPKGMKWRVHADGQRFVPLHRPVDNEALRQLLRA